MSSHRPSLLLKQPTRLISKLQKLKSMGIVIPRESSASCKHKISNYFKYVEENMKADCLSELQGCSWKPPPKPPRKIYAHQKVETSTFDTIEELIVKNRTNLEYLKSYSRNVKESIKADGIHTTDTTKTNTIKKSAFIEEPGQNLIQEFVDAEMDEFVKEKHSLSEHRNSHSISMNNFGRLVPSSSMHQIRASTSENSMRKSIINPSKLSKIKMAVKELNEKEGKLYNELKSSIRRTSNSSISIRSNLDRANILFGNRWNKMFNKIVGKYGLEKEDNILGEQLELCPPRTSTADIIMRPKKTGFTIEESKEYLKKIPTLKYSRV